jgi:hypothetical protein
MSPTERSEDQVGHTRGEVWFALGMRGHYRFDTSGLAGTAVLPAPAVGDKAATTPDVAATATPAMSAASELRFSAVGRDLASKGRRVLMCLRGGCYIGTHQSSTLPVLLSPSAI